MVGSRSSAPSSPRHTNNPEKCAGATGVDKKESEGDRSADISETDDDVAF